MVLLLTVYYIQHFFCVSFHIFLLYSVLWIIRKEYDQLLLPTSMLNQPERRKEILLRGRSKIKGFPPCRLLDIITTTTTCHFANRRRRGHFSERVYILTAEIWCLVYFSYYHPYLIIRCLRKYAVLWKDQNVYV